MHKIIQTVKLHKILIFHSDLSTVSCLSTPGLGRHFLNTAFTSGLSEGDRQSYPSLLNLFPFIQKKMPACPAGMCMPIYQADRQMPGIHHPEDQVKSQLGCVSAMTFCVLCTLQPSQWTHSVLFGGVFLNSSGKQHHYPYP